MNPKFYKVTAFVLFFLVIAFLSFITGYRFGVKGYFFRSRSSFFFDGRPLPSASIGEHPHPPFKKKDHKKTARSKKSLPWQPPCGQTTYPTYHRRKDFFNKPGAPPFPPRRPDHIHSLYGPVIDQTGSMVVIFDRYRTERRADITEIKRLAGLDRVDEIRHDDLVFLFGIPQTNGILKAHYIRLIRSASDTNTNL